MNLNSTPKKYRYFDLLMAGFVTVLIASNVIGVGKVWSFFGLTHFSASVLFFPLSYVFGDVLTEVYGYAQTRRVIWAGFIAMAFISLMSFCVIALPPAQGWQDQAIYEHIFGQTPRIVLASLAAFAGGEFINSYVLAKLKLKTKGQGLRFRLIASTAAGQLIDSLIFFPFAFYGQWPNELLLGVTMNNYLFKVVWEIIALPLTTPLIKKLKQAEQEDYFDRDTDFTPFKLQA